MEKSSIDFDLKSFAPPRRLVWRYIFRQEIAPFALCGASVAVIGLLTRGNWIWASSIAVAPFLSAQCFILYGAYMLLLQKPDYVFVSGLCGIAVIALAASVGAASGGWALILILTNNNSLAASMALIPMLAALILTYGFNEASIRKWSLLLRKKDAQAAQIPSELVYKAQIAGNLLDKLTHVLSNGGTLIVTGGDCHPIGEQSYPWAKYIECLLQRNCTVIQYAVDPSDTANQEFKRLAKNWGEVFEYRKFLSSDADNKHRKTLTYLRTCHPTLAKSADGKMKMVWIEREHPAGGTYAFNCEYWSPKDLEVAPEIYKRWHDFLVAAWSQCPRMEVDVQGRSAQNSQL